MTYTTTANDHLTHFDAAGQAHMVDVGAKTDTHRIAIASGTIRMKPETLAIITGGTAKKGDVLGIARIAAIMASKRTSDLIPLCHPLALTRVAVDFDTDEANASVHCRAQVETFGKTGVEMEALTAVQVGLLTVYDMCKAVDRHMQMDGICVISKVGGKSGDWSVEDKAISKKLPFTAPPRRNSDIDRVQRVPAITKPRISLFAENEREDRRSKMGDPLVRFTKHVDIEALAASINAVAPRPSRAKGCHPPYSTLLMVKVLVLQHIYSLAHDALEYQLQDRRSFLQFFGSPPETCRLARPYPTQGQRN